MVTVSSASQQAPLLFPLVPSCGDSLNQESSLAVGCLAKNFLPNSITLSWDFKNRTTVGTEKFINYPTVLSGQAYSTTSQLMISATEVMMGQDDYVFCKAKHAVGNKEIRVPLRGQGKASKRRVPRDRIVAQPSRPNVSLHIPTREEFLGPELEGTIICQAKHFNPKEISLKWLKNGELLNGGFTTEGPTLDGSKTYQLSSSLTVSDTDWFKATDFTCVVEHPKTHFIEMRNASYKCAGVPSSSIKISTTPPSFAGIFTTKSAKLVCSVTGMSTSDSLSIVWTQYEGKELTTKTSVSKIQPDGTFSATGEASVCAEDWQSGKRFTCTVSHADLPAPQSAYISKQKEVNLHSPAVYVLPPASDQLSLRESATLSCLVKSFSPADVMVQWLHKGQPVPQDKYTVSAPMPEPQSPNLYFAYSTLTVAEEEWSAGDSFTCVVVHEALPLYVMERTVDKSTEGEVNAEEEGFENLWTTASTFIVLFLLSLFYSTTVTLFKVMRN
uniref:Immunoglobulin heavy constant mu n=1 Tax=Ornithorhynchus anatinus TaxID=9258 RepID=A0A6I8P1P3_ORNAN